ncbi:hypothetical protein CCAX7_59880 [Capsulimonas corticalis]|uniref:Uncharacterized protein n=1 Tax=Capsulimonas corticalis TaxID=2219043 RepID=A0A402CZM8_9BACT|nr:hypothetical protein [Capsulimonas corticalis]BDI33937.1 hypothetical protein CCAX7_59880 [Capsulimonas corticalis]
MKKYIIWIFTFPIAAAIGLIAWRTYAGPSLQHFTPFVEQVRMRKVASEMNVRGFHAYQIEIFVGYKAQKPAWWGQDDGEIIGQTLTVTRGKSGPQLLSACFIGKNGTKYPWNISGQLPSLYSHDRDEYYVDCNVEVTNGFDVPNSTLVGVIKMGDGSCTSVRTPVSLAMRYSCQRTPLNP